MQPMIAAMVTTRIALISESLRFIVISIAIHRHRRFIVISEGGYADPPLRIDLIAGINEGEYADPPLRIAIHCSSALAPRFPNLWM